MSESKRPGKRHKYPGVTMFFDHTGKRRWRARKAGKPTVYLPGEFGSEEFVAAWDKWRKGEHTPPSGWVYFMAGVGTGLVKIGFSKSPDSRLKTMSQQSAITYKIITAVPGTFQDEKAFHGKFRHLHETGEWFRYNEELYQHVKQLAELHGSTPWRGVSKPGAKVPMHEDYGGLELE